MRLTLTMMLAMMMVGAVTPAFAELQNVEVGGSLRIRMNYYGAGADGSFDDDNPDAFFVEQRTAVNVKADFTDDVTAFIEMDEYGSWGDSLREDPSLFTGLNGADGPSLDLYQAYIEMREAWGYPLTFRLGRQEIQLGSEFIFGNNDTAGGFAGLYHDAVRMDYDADDFSLTTFWSRVFQDSAFENHADDGNVAAIYGSYTGLEDMTFDGYYVYAGINEGELAPDEGRKFHTVGFRFAGVASQFDWDAELAYQTGDSGIDGVDQEGFAVTADLGYTFDSEYQPRLFMRGNYFSGPDDDGDELGFARLFSDHELSEFLGNTDLSNIWSVGGGVSAQITEEIDMSGVVTYYAVDEDFGADDDDLGLELGLYMTYNYSEDLYIEAGYAHFFAGDAIEDGFVVNGNGTIPAGGGDDDDLNYVYVETGISF